MIAVAVGITLIFVPAGIIAAGILMIVYGVAREMTHEKENNDGTRQLGPRDNAEGRA